MKEITIDPKTWDSSGLTLSAFVLLQLLVEGREHDEFCRILSDNGDTVPDIRKELDEKYLTVMGNVVVPTKEAKKLFDNNNVASWIEEWRNKFPEGASDGGYRWRGNNAICIKKMKQWMKKYHYEQEDIFKATDNYIRRLNGIYTYCMMAPNFIFKDNVENSALLTEIESINAPIKQKAIDYSSTNEMI